MPSYLVTGGSRGIGLEFVEQLLRDSSNTVIATVRSRSDKLEALRSSGANLHIANVDISDPSAIPGLASVVAQAVGADAKLDFLLNSAAMLEGPGVLQTEPETVLKHVGVNVVPSIEIVKALQPHLGRGSVVMNMSSGVGSLHRMKHDRFKVSTAYAVSKAALNMVSVMQANALRDQGVCVVAMDPGHVKTDMGGAAAVTEKADSVSGMLKILAGLTMDDTAKFFVFDGSEVPW